MPPQDLRRLVQWHSPKVAQIITRFFHYLKSSNYLDFGQETRIDKVGDNGGQEGEDEGREPSRLRKARQKLHHCKGYFLSLTANDTDQN